MHLSHIPQCTDQNRNVQWCIVGYGTGALWDLWALSIPDQFWHIMSCLQSISIWESLGHRLIHSWCFYWSTFENLLFGYNGGALLVLCHWIRHKRWIRHEHDTTIKTWRSCRLLGVDLPCLRKKIRHNNVSYLWYSGGVDQDTQNPNIFFVYIVLTL